MKITAIIINGRHGGLLLVTDYQSTIKLPIHNDDQISIGEKYDNSIRIGDFVTYKECFRSVDKQCVLYSVDGRFEEIKYILSKFEPTYPINLFKIC